MKTYAKNQKVYFGGLIPFDMSITYSALDSHAPENTFDSHVHKECEIYINLSGDVSFMVENHIYPILPGNIVITRPYEYHHCIYHSNKIHRNFWILFSCEGNESFFDTFFKRKLGENNVLSLSSIENDELISLCHSMTKAPKTEAEKYYNFFKLISLLEKAESIIPTSEMYPDDIKYALNYINSNFSAPISIHSLAKEANVSLNTLERHFTEFLHTTPSIYIRKKRLANSVKLLSMGCSITEAGSKSGFVDCSSFIALFKKTYGTTPLQYKKNITCS